MNKVDKRKLLGMPLSVAAYRLKKLIIFSLLSRAGMTKCYRCQQSIKSADDMHIDHKSAWVRSGDPSKAFFDMENIGFSHIKCNVRARTGFARVRGVRKIAGNRIRPYRAAITVDGKYINLGYFSDESSAAAAYANAALQFFGPNAVSKNGG